MALTEERWENLKKLSQPTLNSLKELEFEKMTPVQVAVIPVFLQHKDVAVEAITGSGKTLAFLVPLIEMLLRREDKLKKQEIGAVIISPTRELATQIYEVLQTFLTHCPFTSQLFIGGSSVQQDLKLFKENGANIVVATPGRFDDLCERGSAGLALTRCLKSLEVLVLDEADRLLDLGFEQTLNSILQRLPKQRRTGLFSATQTDSVKALVRAGLRNPVSIRVLEKPGAKPEGQRTPSTLSNYYMTVPAEQKLNQLVQFLRERRDSKVMVFLATCACTEHFAKLLDAILKKTTVMSIHGKMKQKRNKIFANFRQMQSGVLLCTDVMARGIDVLDVDWVVQFDPPKSASAFVHRCGRTARIGRTGSALLMLLPTEESFVNFLELNQKVPLQQLSPSEDPPDVMGRVRKLCSTQREFYEKGLTAFVSFMQAYAKHECHLIFRMKELDIGALGMGFGLLHLPRMPELKGRTTDAFTATELDYAGIPFKDKAREKWRQEHQQTKAAEKRKKREEMMKRRKESAPWSKQKAAKEKKAKKVAGKAMRGGKKRRRAEDDEDEEELERDARLLKKLKKGKITEKECDENMGLSSDSEGADSDS